MAELSLEKFRNAISDVTRPNRFWVKLTKPGGGSIKDDGKPENSASLSDYKPEYEFMVKTASIPGRTVGNIELNWQGMKYNIAGDPTFEDITLTFVNNYAWDLRLFFENWLEKIAQMNTNERGKPISYKSDGIQMQQLGRTTKDVLATYTLVGAYPTTMAAMDLSMENNDQTQEISVTFKYDYFTTDNTKK